MKTPVKSSVNFVSGTALKNILPEDQKIASLLLSCGQLECELAFDDYDITMFSNRWANYEFWDCIIKNPYRVADMSDELHQRMFPQMIYLLQEQWVKMKDPYFRSAIYFLLNRYSFDGSVSHGKFDTNNYSAICSRSLINFYENNETSKLKINYYKAEKYYEAVPHIPAEHILFLPVGNIKVGPLHKQTFVGHDVYDINYAILSDIMKNSDTRLVAVFKKNTRILRDFKNFNTVMVNSVGQLTDKISECDEIIVHNLERR